jgi:biotin carboxylase
VVTPQTAQDPPEALAPADLVVLIEKEFESEEAGIEAYHKILATGVQVDAIFPATEFGVVLCARLGSLLGVEANPPKVGIMLRNKLQQRQLLSRMGFPSPKYHGFSNKTGLRKIAGRLNYPIVLKPVNGAGKIGVGRYDSAVGLLSAFDNVKEDATSRFSYLALGRGWLVEQFLPGAKYTLELIANGEEILPLVLTETTVVGSHFIEMGHALPAQLPSHLAEKAKCLGVDILRALKIRHGVVHLELLLHSESSEFFIIELNGRIPGGKVPHLIEQASGNNYYQLIIATLLSRKLPNIRPFTQAAAVHWFCRQNGIVTRIDGFQELDTSPGFVQKYIGLNIGDRANATSDGFDRIGYSMNIASDLSSAQRFAREAAEKVKIQYA